MKTVGILSPGDMGHTVGERLKANGLRVIAHLADRSARTQGLAEKAGIEEVDSYDALLRKRMSYCAFSFRPRRREPRRR